jgi:uncharacterized protein involved in exopolysaccharide biosynthesis
MPNLPDAPNPASNDQPISLLEIAIALLRHWRMVIVLPLLLAAAAGLWSITRERTYVATASLIQKGSDSRSPGGAAVIAQQLGVNLGGAQATESPMFFMDLLRSKALLRKTVEATYEINSPTGPWRGTLIQYWNVPADGSVPTWLRAADQLRDAVKPVVNRETGILTFTVTATHPKLSEQIAAKLLELLNDFNLEVRQGRALDEGRFIGGRVSEAEKKLIAAELALRDFLRSNRQYQSSPELVLEHDRLERTVMMRQEVFTSALRSQEQASIDAIRDTPLFTVIDPPTDSAMPQSRGTITKAISGFVIGLLLSLLVAVAREVMKRRHVSSNPDSQEIRALFGQVLSDLRRPSRWFRSAQASTAASGD